MQTNAQELERRIVALEKSMDINHDKRFNLVCALIAGDTRPMPHLKDLWAARIRAYWRDADEILAAEPRKEGGR